MNRSSWICLGLTLPICLGLIGCASKSPSKQTAASKPGVYYKDDGPPAALPADIDRIADAIPRDEPLHRFANRPYNVFGVNYTPMTTLASFTERGIASWYGRKFHGQKTAIGETYDMFAMSAAHPTAPLPSFARVTSVKSGKSIIVRVNDRGPFHANRIVDLSYAAAHRLGVAQAGSGEVVFELLAPPFTPRAGSETVATATTAPPNTSAREQLPVSSDGSNESAAARFAPENKPNQQFFVQLGAFGNFTNAQSFQGRMNDELVVNAVVRQVGALFRVQIGPFASMAAAQSAREAAQQRLGVALPIITENAKP